LQKYIAKLKCYLLCLIAELLGHSFQVG